MGKPSHETPYKDGAAHAADNTARARIYEKQLLAWVDQREFFLADLYYHSAHRYWVRAVIGLAQWMHEDG